MEGMPGYGNSIANEWSQQHVECAQGSHSCLVRQDRGSHKSWKLRLEMDSGESRKGSEPFEVVGSVEVGATFISATSFSR